MTHDHSRRTVLQSLAAAGAGFSVGPAAASGESSDDQSPDDTPLPGRVFESSVSVVNDDDVERTVTVEVVARDGPAAGRPAFERSYALDAMGAVERGPVSGTPAHVAKEGVRLPVGPGTTYEVHASLPNRPSSSAMVEIPDDRVPQNQLVTVRVSDGKPVVRPWVI
jgi:hypothetical protein